MVDKIYGQSNYYHTVVVTTIRNNGTFNFINETMKKIN